jgi:hypothetical protein
LTKGKNQFTISLWDKKGVRKNERSKTLCYDEDSRQNKKVGKTIKGDIGENGRESGSCRIESCQELRDNLYPAFLVG